MLRKLIPLAMLFLVPACFKAPHDAEYDWQNPDKIYIDGKIKNAVDLPVAGAEIKLDADVWGLTAADGFFAAESIDPGIYKLGITSSNPLYDTVIIDACSLWAGRVIEDTTFYFKRAVWDMENEPNPLPRLWTPSLGVWQIGPDDKPGNRVLTLKTELPCGYYGRLQCDGVFKDFGVELSVRPLTTNLPHQWWGTLTFCMQDPDHYYFLNISQDLVVLGRHEAGVDSTLAAEARSMPLGTWYRLRVERIGTMLRAFVDGDQVGGDVNDARYADGRIGIIAFGENHTVATWFFDNIVIEPRRP